MYLCLFVPNAIPVFSMLCMSVSCQSVDVKKPSLEPQPRSSYHFKHDRIEPGKYQYYSIPITSAGARVGDDIVGEHSM